MLVTDIKFFKSKIIGDTSTNGGLINLANAVVSGIKGAVFPRVTSAERTSGKTRYRKLFLANRNASGETLGDAKVFLGSQSNGDDVFYIAPATDRDDTQAEASAIASWYGCGTVNSPVSAGATSVSLLFEDDDFATDFTQIYITDGVNYEVAEVSGASFSGNVCTVTLSAGLVNAYSVGNKAGVVVALGDLTTTKSQNALSSASGIINIEYMTLNNVGCIDDTFTLTFTSATTFTVNGANSGTLAGGTTSSTYAPTNSVSGQPLFSISPSFWGGAWTAGDYVKIDTQGAYAPLWLKEVVPAGADYEPDNSVNLSWLAD